MEKQIADEIITEYLSRIYGFSIQKAFSYDEAEDICSDIVSELYASLLKSKDIYNIDGYIWRISNSVYSKYVSSKKKHQSISQESIEALAIPYEDVYHLGEDEEETLRLRREISFLTKTRREIIFAFYYENKTISTISSEKNLPEGTVKWHLNKARNTIKEGYKMERKIGKLGMKPVKATDLGHSGIAGFKYGPEFYLKGQLELNIVYSVYKTPKTKEEIAEELGITPVYIEDKIEILEENGFLVRRSGERFTTYVLFTPEIYSLELEDNILKKQFEVAEMLVKEYVSEVREAVSDIKDVYIPGGNRELFEAAVTFYGIAHKCNLTIRKDLSQYYIKTTDGGNFIAHVELEAAKSDPDYKAVIDRKTLGYGGDMTRASKKYPVYSWAIDTHNTVREGAWHNNLLSDYEYLYEFMTGVIEDNSANAEKYARLRERRYIDQENKVNIMVVKGESEEFFEKIPVLNEKLKKRYASYALETAEMIAREYPPHMRDLIMSQSIGDFIGARVAIMVMNILYSNGTFKALEENERVTTNLLMFCDTLPTQ